MYIFLAGLVVKHEHSRQCSNYVSRTQRPVAVGSSFYNKYNVDVEITKITLASIWKFWNYDDLRELVYTYCQFVKNEFSVKSW